MYFCHFSDILTESKRNELSIELLLAKLAVFKMYRQLDIVTFNVTDAFKTNVFAVMLFVKPSW